jgi:hypothetical protein
LTRERKKIHIPKFLCGKKVSNAKRQPNTNNKFEKWMETGKIIILRALGEIMRGRERD